MPDRPNFILFVTDQHRADFLGCMGHPVLKTPHIDAIAARGTVWDRFYVASPVCMPNRASLMTCRMPSSHGVRSNGIPLDRRHVTFVELLRAAGYRTALIGKSHLQNFTGQPPMLPSAQTRAGFHRAAPPLAEAVRHDHSGYRQEAPGRDYAVQTPFYGFDHVELVTGHGDFCGGDYRRWLLGKDPMADQLVGAENEIPHDYVCPQAVRTALPESLYSTRYIAERASAWLAGQPDDRPYFLMVSFPDPHHPFNPPGHYWDMYRPKDMPLPEAFRINDWTPPPHVAGVLADRATGRAALGGMGSIGTTAREAQEAQALTCGMIAMIDDAVGAVRAMPGAQDAVTVFTADHGDHLGDHRLLFKGVEQYEQLTRVPFIWSDPEAESGDRTAAIGQTIDIGTTILERARIEKAEGMAGRALQAGGREAAFIQFENQRKSPALGHAPRVHSLRTQRWRLSVFDTVGWGELYDLQSDPGEFRNLWDDPAYADQRAELVEALLRAEIGAVDRSPGPTGMA